MSQDKIDPATPILAAESSPVQQALTKEFLGDSPLQDITILKDGYKLLNAIKEKKIWFHGYRSPSKQINIKGQLT